MSKGASIINMSFGGSVPASLSWSVAPFDAFTALMRSKGGLLFAASGNDGFVDVDRESCLIACWESAWGAATSALTPLTPARTKRSAAWPWAGRPGLSKSAWMRNPASQTAHLLTKLRESCLAQGRAD